MHFSVEPDVNWFSHMAIGRGNNILTFCQPVHSASSRVRQLLACASTLLDKKNQKDKMLQSEILLYFNKF